MWRVDRGWEAVTDVIKSGCPNSQTGYELWDPEVAEIMGDWVAKDGREWACQAPGGQGVSLVIHGCKREFALSAPPWTPLCPLSTHVCGPPALCLGKRALTLEEESTVQVGFIPLLKGHGSPPPSNSMLQFQQMLLPCFPLMVNSLFGVLYSLP